MSNTRSPDVVHKSGAGIELREAYFPDRAPIDAYGNHGFRFAGMSHKGGLLCLPSGIYGWNVSTIDHITKPESLERAFGEGDALELLFVGTGRDLIPLSEEVRQAFAQADIRLEVMSTGAAIRTFNVLLAEGRKVGAALLPVE